MRPRRKKEVTRTLKDLSERYKKREAIAFNYEVVAYRKGRKVRTDQQIRYISFNARTTLSRMSDNENVATMLKWLSDRIVSPEDIELKLMNPHGEIVDGNCALEKVRDLRPWSQRAYDKELNEVEREKGLEGLAMALNEAGFDVDDVDSDQLEALIKELSIALSQKKLLAKLAEHYDEMVS